MNSFADSSSDSSADPSSAVSLPEPAEEITEQIYEQLRALARRQLGRLRPGDTLNTTSLVHEAYLKLTDGSSATWQNRTHFMAMASRSMRYIIVDSLKHRRAQKRGGGIPDESIDAIEVAAPERIDLLELNDSLERLEKDDQRLARIVEHHFFGGMTFKEVAEAMDVSERTVRRKWKKARLWLYRDMMTSEE